MGPEDYVNSINDDERPSPPDEQLEANVSWWRDDIPPSIDHSFFEDQYFRDEDTAENMPTSHTYVSYPTNALNEDWSYSAFRGNTQAMSAASVTAANPDQGYSYDNTVTVNEPGNEQFSDILNSISLPHGRQINANASNNFTDPHLNPTQSRAGFSDLADRAPSEDPIFYNNYVQSPYAVLPPTYMSQSVEDQTDTQTAFKVPQLSTSPLIEPPRRPRKRRRASTNSMQTPEASRLKRQCLGCEKPFYASKDPEGSRCTRCYDKHVKHSAGHTTYNFDPNANVDSAWLTLYPQVAPLALVGDDVDVAKTYHQDYCRRLIEAISLPYTSDETGTKENQQRVAQQTKLNRKPFDSRQYRDDLVNARVRFLYQIALSYHAGGPSMYDTGGDNSGYGEDRTMKFSDRMERLIQLLTTDKDIAMDVIEGRGVTALVHNPNKYERRKRDNKKSNDTKQDLQEKGKQLHMLEAVGGNGGGGGVGATPSGNLAPSLDLAYNDSMQQHAHSGGVAQFSGSYDDAALQSGLANAHASENKDGPVSYFGNLEGYAPARFF